VTQLFLDRSSLTIFCCLLILFKVFFLFVIFTTDNWCSMEFDSFGLSVKDLTTRNVITRSNSINLLYTLCLPRSTNSGHTSQCAMSAITSPHILAAATTSMWHCHLGHHGPDALYSLYMSSFISCTNTTHDFCHACQLGKHTRLHFPVHRVVWKSL
jgi:hypothetical protein